MDKIKKCLLCIFGGLLAAAYLSGCAVGGQADADEDYTPAQSLTYTGSMELKYADQFSVDYYDDIYSLITVSDGSRYLVVPEGADVPSDLDESVALIKQPLTDIYMAATAVMADFGALDGYDAISFCSQEADDWYVESAREAMENGAFVFAGKYSEPDYELLVSEGCALAIESTMINHVPDVKEKLEELGICVFTDWSSYESHPLGRTEWIKLYGELLGKREAAFSFFDEQSAYLENMEITKDGSVSVVFFYFNSAGQPVVRKSGDYLAKMIELAGGDYVFDNLGDEENALSTVKLEMEEFYATARDADCVIYNTSVGGELTSLDDLVQGNELLLDFKAVQEGNVWCTEQNLYQDTTGIGLAIEEMNRIFYEENPQGLTYFYRLE